LEKKTGFITIIVVVIIAAAALFAYFSYGAGALEIIMSKPSEEWGEATQIYLNCSTIEIHRAQANNESGWFTVVDNSAWINLTKTLNVNQTIGHKNLKAGLYNLIRFKILDARITVGGKNYTALVPNDELTIAITEGGIRVNNGQKVTLLIEINAKVEGSKTTGNFRIVPAVRATPV